MPEPLHTYRGPDRSLFVRGLGRRGEAPAVPPERRRETAATVPGAIAFNQYEGSVGFLAVADTFAEVFRFSGYPDSIVLAARVAAARVRIRDLTGNAVGEIGVNAGESVETSLVGRIVEAQEVVAAAGAELSVVGKWAEPKLGGDGR